MPRPQKCRRVCAMPQRCRFAPEEGGGEVLRMTVDEFEAIRLMDHMGYTQEQCAQQMGISRPTVTGIYGSARRKLAAFLVEGRRLVIEGGPVEVCPHGGGCGHFYRRAHCKKEEKIHHENRSNL